MLERASSVASEWRDMLSGVAWLALFLPRIVPMTPATVAVWSIPAAASARSSGLLTTQSELAAA